MQERGTKYTPAPTAHSSARCKFVNDFLQLIFVLFSTNFFLRTVNDLQWSVFLTVWVLRNWGNFQFHSFCFEFSALHLPVFPRPWPCSELTFYPLKQRECLVLLDWIIKPGVPSVSKSVKTLSRQWWCHFLSTYLWYHLWPIRSQYFRAQSRTCGCLLYKWKTDCKLMWSSWNKKNEAPFVGCKDFM